MCTVSWLRDEGGYHLLFNRDEQRSRSQALIPQVFDFLGRKIIMPIDPDGNGSWISTNQYRLSLCLLNFYQGDIPKGKLTSRGLLLKELSHHQYPDDIAQALSTLKLENYAPFSLLVLGYQPSSQLMVKMWVWDGHTLTANTPNSPYTSSSVAFEQVSSERMALARNFPVDVCVRDLESYHRSHAPAKGKLSVCMHREDAKSVSFSRISVQAQRVDFYYKNAAPCSNVPLNKLSLALQLTADA